MIDLSNAWSLVLSTAFHYLQTQKIFTSSDRKAPYRVLSVDQDRIRVYRENGNPVTLTQ